MILNFEKIWSDYRPNLLIGLTLIASFFLFLRPATDPDLGWHLRQGEIVVEEKRLVRSDEFSYTLSGYPWSPYWLSEAGFYLINKHLGLWALSVATAIIATIAFWLMALATVKKPKTNAVIFAVLIAVVISFPFSGVRIQLISWLLFSIFWLLMIHKFYLNRWSVVALPILILIWANLHFGFLIGIALFGLVVISENIKLIGFKIFQIRNWFFNQVLKTPKLLQINLTFLLLILASIVTPYGFGSYQSALGFTTSKINIYNIAEWLPLTIRSDFGITFIFFVAIVIWFIARSMNHITPFELIAAAGLIFASLSSMRHIPFALLILVSLTVKLWPKIDLPDQIITFGRLYILVAIFMIALFMGYSQIKEVTSSSFNLKTLADKANYPHEAVEFIKANPIAGNVFNEYGWGGYLIWQLPNSATFIDGRMPGWKLGGRDILADYLKIWEVSPKTNELLQEYQIDWALLAPDSPITSYLKLAGWQEVFADDKSSILVKGK